MTDSAPVLLPPNQFPHFYRGGDRIGELRGGPGGPRRPEDWIGSTGTQLKHEVARIGGILLIMGVLHALNVVALPIIGGLLSNNKLLEQHVEGSASAAGSPSPPPLGPGTWILRVEAAPTSSLGAPTEPAP